MARVKTVKKARKDPGFCGRCREELKKGDAYKWWSFYRSKHKNIRCLKPECRPRASELTESKFAEVYEAQEMVDDELSKFDEYVQALDLPPDSDGAMTVEEILDNYRQLCDEAASQIEDVANEYRDSAYTIQDSFPDSEKAQDLEACADELEAYATDLRDCVDNLDEVPPAEDGPQALSDWLEELRSCVEEAMNNDLPDIPGY